MSNIFQDFHMIQSLITFLAQSPEYPTQSHIFIATLAQNASTKKRERDTVE